VSRLTTPDSSLREGDLTQTELTRETRVAADLSSFSKPNAITINSASTTEDGLAVEKMLVVATTA